MNFKRLVIALLMWFGLVASAHAAVDTSVSTTGVQGYDLVSYQTNKRPLKGNGHFVSIRDGVAYQFINEENKKLFDLDPDKYLPAYGGYCAYGVSVEKKFIGDPEVWRIVDGKLYLNLDMNIQKEWLKDVPGRIKTANVNWKKIRNTPADKL